MSHSTFYSVTYPPIQKKSFICPSQNKQNNTQAERSETLGYMELMDMKMCFDSGSGSDTNDSKAFGKGSAKVGKTESSIPF